MHHSIICVSVLDFIVWLILLQVQKKASNKRKRYRDKAASSTIGNSNNNNASPHHQSLTESNSAALSISIGSCTYSLSQVYVKIQHAQKVCYFFPVSFCSMTLCSVGVSWEKLGAELFVVPTRQGTLTLLGRISWWASPKSSKHPWGYNLQLTPWILHPCTLCLLQLDGNFSDVDLNQIKLFGNFPQPRTPEDKIYNLHLGSFTQVQQLLKCWTVWKI